MKSNAKPLEFARNYRNRANKDLRFWPPTVLDSVMAAIPVPPPLFTASGIFDINTKGR
jgi:hypothetical protein